MPDVGYTIASIQRKFRAVQRTTATTDPMTFEPIINNIQPNVGGLKNRHLAYRHTILEVEGTPLMTMSVKTTGTSGVATLEFSNFTNTAFVTGLTVTGPGGGSVNQAWAYARVRTTTLDAATDIIVQAQN